ncbi:hypothetical protein B0H15DRAFT_931394 [Mycena belliarum]|uniref:Uncharacterized protein n=1 Tax=Mycena belliarum TaxID=1033014 RepID=A0AAD6XR91_9AGAR|nr:hypothetical protein B0H15DRAFT_931394 [Mycena belliae]
MYLGILTLECGRYLAVKTGSQLAFDKPCKRCSSQFKTPKLWLFSARLVTLRDHHSGLESESFNSRAFIFQVTETRFRLGLMALNEAFTRFVFAQAIDQPSITDLRSIAQRLCIWRTRCVLTERKDHERLSAEVTEREDFKRPLVEADLRKSSRSNMGETMPVCPATAETPKLCSRTSQRSITTTEVIRGHRFCAQNTNRYFASGFARRRLPQTKYCVPFRSN